MTTTAECTVTVEETPLNLMGTADGSIDAAPAKAASEPQRQGRASPLPVTAYLVARARLERWLMSVIFAPATLASLKQRKVGWADCLAGGSEELRTLRTLVFHSTDAEELVETLVREKGIDPWFIHQLCALAQHVAGIPCGTRVELMGDERSPRGWHLKQPVLVEEARRRLLNGRAWMDMCNQERRERQMKAAA